MYLIFIQADEFEFVSDFFVIQLIFRNRTCSYRYIGGYITMNDVIRYIRNFLFILFNFAILKTKIGRSGDRLKIKSVPAAQKRRFGVVSRESRQPDALTAVCVRLESPRSIMRAGRKRIARLRSATVNLQPHIYRERTNERTNVRTAKMRPNTDAPLVKIRQANRRHIFPSFVPVFVQYSHNLTVFQQPPLRHSVDSFFFFWKI